MFKYIDVLLKFINIMRIIRHCERKYNIKIQYCKISDDLHNSINLVKLHKRFNLVDRSYFLKYKEGDIQLGGYNGNLYKYNIYNFK